MAGEEFFSANFFNPDGIYRLVSKFDVSRPRYATGIIKAERILPDTDAVVFIWGAFYVLYREDSITSLKEVSRTIESWFPCTVKAYVKPKAECAQKEATDDMRENEWMRWAIEDGGGYALVAEVLPTTDNDSYWVNSKTVPLEELPPEVRKRLQAQKSILDDPNRSFLETCQEKITIDTEETGFVEPHV